jgi:hypothetical protein
MDSAAVPTHSAAIAAYPRRDAPKLPLVTPWPGSLVTAGTWGYLVVPKPQLQANWQETCGEPARSDDQVDLMGDG